ncbi:Serine/threonine-protein kinase PknA [Crateriforma conspicua]|uniref:Serine/threonine-protein kinase PknA n=2 Tax=Planctomycetaceae TaxID=126 RepID=A0A5C6FMF7_9PLAN|nr:Serine/threonine-protein kinase PknA [Crateriforma conspicua]
MPTVSHLPINHMARSRLGPLAIETKLGDHPSRSSVWRAIHLKQKAAVAVKVFNVPFGGTPETRAEFKSEWDQLKTIRHPGIAKCYGGGFEQTDAYLAYELIDGETLDSMLIRRDRLPWETVLDLAEGIVDALEYLHERQMYHGRLQPDKVIVAGLSPILVDMRLARGDGPFQTGRPLEAHELAYRAPETVDDDAATGVKSDLYALGVIMYRCLTGRLPYDADTPTEMRDAVRHAAPTSPATVVMDLPVWMDKLVGQLIHPESASRPAGAAAVKMGLAEVRKRSMSRAGVAEQVSSGFSPVQIGDQSQRDEARVLLGQQIVDLDDDQPVDDASWYDQWWALLLGLAAIIGLLAYFMWPLGEDQMRQRAEDLLAEGTRGAKIQAKISYLQPMLDKFPNGEHATWAADQIEQVEMVEAEHFLSVKMKRNLPLRGEGERLYAEALQYQRFGDDASALAKYRSIVTLLADQDQYRAFVNLARRQIAQIESTGQKGGEAAGIIIAKMKEADSAYRSGNVIAARKIWYSIIDLYADNAAVAPLVQQAQDRIEAVASGAN